MRSIGLDLGARKIAFCEVVGGVVTARQTVENLGSLMCAIGPNTPQARVAIEACREAWFVHDKLTEWGHEVLLVDTTRVAKLGIGNHGRKTDRIDAEVLARAVESGHIPVAHVLSPKRRELRLQLQVRRALVESRTQYIVTIRGILRAAGQGKVVPHCDSENFARHLRDAKVDEHLRAICSPLYETLLTLDKQLALADHRLAALCAEEPIVDLLATAPGVGVIVAAAFISVIDEANRFRRAHQVQSYVGLVPSEDSSGDRRRLGAITKKGNGYLRSLLVQSAQCILRKADPSDPLAIWGSAVATRRGKRIAVVAVARRLVGILWAMWRGGTVYDSAFLANASADGLSTSAQSTALRAKAMAESSAKRKRFTRAARRLPDPTLAKTPRAAPRAKRRGKGANASP